MKKVKQRHAPRRKPVLKGRAAREREGYRLALARSAVIVDERDRQEEETFLASVASTPPMMAAALPVADV